MSANQAKTTKNSQKRQSEMTREERRKQMPISTALIDAWRAAFGEMKSIKARENGLTVDWRKA